LILDVEDIAYFVSPEIPTMICIRSFAAHPYVVDADWNLMSSLDESDKAYRVLYG